MSDLSFEEELKRNKVKFKAILTCFNDALDGLIVRSVDNKWNLDPQLAVDVAIQLTAAAFRESFKPYDNDKSSPKSTDESTEDLEDLPEEE